MAVVLAHWLRKTGSLKVHPLIALSIFLLGGYACLRWFERVNMFYPSPDIAGGPDAFGLAYEPVALRTRDGVKISAWYIPNKSGPVVLFSYGNAGNMSGRLDKAALLHGLGLGVLLYDYRGYGLSSGRPTEKGMYKDAEAAYDWLVENKKFAPDKIIFYGESLGTGVSAELALRHKPAALILESPYTSMAAMCNVFYPALPSKLLVSYKYDTLSKIAKIDSPLLILHSKDDELVPYFMARQIFAAAVSAPKELVELSGGHNSGYAVSGKTYREGIKIFLTKCGLLK